MFLAVGQQTSQCQNVFSMHIQSVLEGVSGKPDVGLRCAFQTAIDLLVNLHQNPEHYPLLASGTCARAPRSLPDSGMPLNEVASEAATSIAAGLCNVHHPFYLGYISPKPHPAVILGDFLASISNQTPGAWRAGPEATNVEVEVLSWLRELFHLPRAAGPLPGGILVGGGTIANTIALRLSLADVSAPSGLSPAVENSLFYCSDQAHFSVAKGLKFINVPGSNLRIIPSAEDGTIDVAKLAESIRVDRISGWRPRCIVANYGTTATGAVDNIAALRAVADEANAWLHVDAASGLALRVLEGMRKPPLDPSVADSITFDPCKWMYAPFGLGCLFVKQPEYLHQFFNTGGPYWEDLEELDLFQMNLYGTRQFRSLGIWTLLKHLGADGYKGVIEHVVQAAEMLRVCLAQDAKIEVLRPTLPTPIVCFRAMNSHIQAAELVQALQASNIAYATVLQWKEQEYVRLAFSNFGITRSHVVDLAQKLRDALSSRSNRIEST